MKSSGGRVVSNRKVHSLESRFITTVRPVAPTVIRFAGAARRWSLVFIDPLIAPAQRNAVDSSWRSQMVDAPSWCVVWFAGVIAEIAGTLPAIDPWRQSPPRSWDDAIDIADPGSEAPGLDPVYVALADPLDEKSSEMITLAFAGWELLSEYIAALRETVGADELFDLCTDALRWLIWRRRAYMPPTPETWVMVTMWSWAFRSPALADGSGEFDEEIALAITEHRLPTSMVRENPGGGSADT